MKNMFSFLTKQKQKWFLVVYYDELCGYEKYLTQECPIIKNDEISITNYFEINVHISMIDSINADCLKFKIIKSFSKITKYIFEL